jgi:S-ribosylhomocysteine lyase LuxS involved in autoinducer biosynthesis
MKPISNQIYYSLKSYGEDEIGMLSHNLFIEFLQFRWQPMDRDEIHTLDHMLEYLIQVQLENEEI